RPRIRRARASAWRASGYQRHASAQRVPGSGGLPGAVRQRALAGAGLGNLRKALDGDAEFARRVGYAVGDEVGRHTSGAEALARARAGADDFIDRCRAWVADGISHEPTSFVIEVTTP